MFERFVENKVDFFQEGDVVMVTRFSGEEMAGIIHDIEESGRVFIDYGGIVSLLHDNEVVIQAPEEIREALELRLRQNSQYLHAEMLETTSGLRNALEEFHRNRNFFCVDLE